MGTAMASSCCGGCRAADDGQPGWQQPRPGFLHAAALKAGALAVVQPVLVTSVAQALPVRELLDRTWPSAGQVVAAAVLGSGVAIFVTATDPGTGRAVPDARGAAAMIGAGMTLAGLCSVIAARTRSDRVAGFTLGLAAGTLYGLVGGVLKATVQAALRDPATTVTRWPLWALAILGVWAFIIRQRAYTRAPLRVSLPALSVANPLAGVVFGMLVFREMPADRPLALVGQALGLAAIVVSVTMLARPLSSTGQGGLTLADRTVDRCPAGPGRNRTAVRPTSSADETRT